MTPTLRTLLASAVDYAGLFPPASLDIKTSVANYARYAGAEHAWMLGRFVLAADRLDEFDGAARAHADGGAWRLSAVAGEDVDEAFDRIARYNEESNKPGRIDMAEVRATSADDVERIAAKAPKGVQVFVELSNDEDPRPMIAVLAAKRLRAKIRAGGVKPGMFPSPETVSRFIRGCFAQSVPFKATAGLHHPIRSEHPLTYEPHAERGVMHGFLNVMLLAAFCYNGIGVADAPALLREGDAGNFRFDDTGARWRDYYVSDDELTAIRRRFAISFGSCSFEEPVADLKKLNLI